MNGITTADLLTVQRNITDAHREDMRALRTDVSTQIKDVRAEQRDQKRELGELRTLVEERTKPGAAFELSRKQKAAVASAGIAVLGAVGEGARHLVVWVIAYLKAGVVVR